MRQGKDLLAVRMGLGRLLLTAFALQCKSEPPTVEKARYQSSDSTWDGLRILVFLRLSKTAPGIQITFQKCELVV